MDERVQARMTQVRNLRALEHPRVLKRKRAEVRVTLEDAEGALSHEIILAQLEGATL